MTPEEMQVAFSVELNEQTGLPPLDSQDIFYWLNQAQVEWVIDQFEGANRSKEGFEQSQVITDYLRPLVEKDVSMTPYWEKSGSFSTFYVEKATFPTDLLFFISARADVRYNPFGLDWFESTSTIDGQEQPVRSVRGDYLQNITLVRISQQDDSYKMLSDPFNRPIYTSPVADLSDSFINVYTSDQFTVTKVLFNYLRVPQDIDPATDTSCELPKAIHSKIVKGAVQLFIQSPKFNTEQ